MIEVLGRRNSLNVQKVMWTLGELMLEYQRQDVGGSFGFPDDYPTLNPNAVVPTIRDGGLTLWESNGCVRYLARRYGEASLWPLQPAVLAVADQWMEWQRSEVGTAFFQVFINKIRLAPEQAKADQIPRGVTGLRRWYEVLDQHLASNRFVAGDDFSMGDIPLGAMTYRYMTLDIERGPFAHVQRWYDQLASRPAYQHHVMIPYGGNSQEWEVAEQASAGVQ
ncbi:MAG: glutathione S-transferase family protein [Pseudomonadales bacterium]